MEDAESGNHTRLETLVKLGARPNEQLPSTYNIPLSRPPKLHARPNEAVKNISALHLAAVRGHAACAEILLRLGADPHVALPDLRVALDLAAQQGHTDTVRMLVQYALKLPTTPTNAESSSSNSAVNTVDDSASNGVDESDEGTLVAAVMKLGSLMTLEDNVTLLHALVVQDRDGTPFGKKADWLVRMGVRLDSLTVLKVTPLHYAAQQGCTELVRRLIHLGGNVLAKAKRHTNPMHLAAMEGHLSCVELLLQNGSGVDVPNKDGDTSLYQAARNGHAHVVTFLLANGAEVEHINANGLTPLQDMANTNFGDVMRILADAGAQVDRWVMGFQPIHVSSHYGRHEAVKALIQKGAKCDIPGENGDRPLHVAAYGGHVETVKLLLAENVTVDARTSTGGTALSLAAMNGHWRVCELLAKAGADLDARSKEELPALNQALSRCQVETARVLLDLGASVVIADKANAARYRRPVITEANNMGYDLTRLLVNRGATVPPDFLHESVAKDRPEVVHALVDLGFDIEESGPDNSPETPLHRASQLGNIKIMEILLNKGANIEAVDRNMQTPLYRAIIGDKLGAMDLLIKRGANIEIRTKAKTTPLELAILHEDPDLANLLINSGADVTRKLEEGTTALHQAATARLKSTVSLLLSKGANLFAMNDQGDTPLEAVIRVRKIMKDLERARDLNEIINILSTHILALKAPPKQPKRKRLYK